MEQPASTGQPVEESPERKVELRRALYGSVVGTALEWYDFFIYGTAAVTVFGDLFFAGSDPTVARLSALATFGVGFLFRPLGGFLFGRIGDRIGRRQTLIITTLVMGLSTGVIGLLPTHQQIGLLAPLLLVLLRICQGLGAGAEFGGASTLLSEHAPAQRRGFFSSFAQTGVQIGLVLGNVAFLLVGLLPDDDLFSWGWRIPFLVSFAMIFVSLYVRLRVAESPVFRALERTNTVERSPILQAIRRYPRSFLIGIGAHVADTAVVYIYSTLVVSYITEELGMERWTALSGIIMFGVVVIALQPVYGKLSDRIGRRPLNLFSVVFTAVFAFPLFLLINTEVPVLIWLALIVATGLGFAPMIAVQPAFYSELFGANVRYTGFAASREIGAAIGGFSPFVSAWLLGVGGGAPWLVAGWIILVCAVSFLAFWWAAERKDIDIAET